MLTGLAGMPSAGAGERMVVPVRETQLVRPKGLAVQGPLPRPLLMVKMEERGEFFDDPSITSYRVFDPAAPEKGLRTVFHGPGNSQHISFHTPLFGGWGLASGRLDRNKDADGDRTMFWFNLLDGKVGPVVGGAPWGERLDESGMVYLSREPTVGDTSDLERVVRIDPLDGTMRVAEQPVTDIVWLGSNVLIGSATIEGEPRFIRLDVAKAELEVIDAYPAGYVQDSFFRGGIFPAGPGGLGGYYVINGFELWYLPSGQAGRRPDAGNWNRVIKDVHIVKTFGGVAPSLPVKYVGAGRFAVAKTVKDEIPMPDAVPEDERVFGAAEAVTMLIDGSSGKVLETTAGYYYNHNPHLSIPDAWWSAGLKPKPAPEPSEAPSLFRWNADMTVVTFAGDGREPCGPDEKSRLSDDGRYLVVYSKFTQAIDGAVRAKLRIMDGQSGEVHEVAVPSGYSEVLTDVGWETLCAEKPDRKVLRAYGSRGMEWFRERLGR